MDSRWVWEERSEGNKRKVDVRASKKLAGRSHREKLQKGSASWGTRKNVFDTEGWKKVALLR